MKFPRQTDPSLGANGDDAENDLVSAELTLQPASESTEASPASPADLTAPSNLLVTFLEHCSIVMQDVKTNTSQNTVKLRYVFAFYLMSEELFVSHISPVNQMLFSIGHRCTVLHWCEQSFSASGRMHGCFETHLT